MKHVLVLLALVAGAAWADGDRHGSRSLPPNDTYRDECGACHAPYPPGLLPADAWKRVMSGLARHYGADASLEPATAASLAAWLDAHAGLRRAEAPPEDRITRSRWFVREHDEVPAAAWTRKSVGSAANCTACHEGAARGDYDEHAVRIPR